MIMGRFRSRDQVTELNANANVVYLIYSTKTGNSTGGKSSRKHAYIILTPLNPTFI